MLPNYLLTAVRKIRRQALYLHQYRRPGGRPGLLRGDHLYVTNELSYDRFSIGRRPDIPDRFPLGERRR
ncbi:MAG: hypothetical protein MZU79_01435 [Anaerotruncus sp.]|nr:hypothetical protein [Anaerotruncus sp.]